MLTNSFFIFSFSIQQIKPTTNFHCVTNVVSIFLYCLIYSTYNTNPFKYSPSG